MEKILSSGPLMLNFSLSASVTEREINSSNKMLAGRRSDNEYFWHYLNVHNVNWPHNNNDSAIPSDRIPVLIDNTGPCMKTPRLWEPMIILPYNKIINK